MHRAALTALTVALAIPCPAPAQAWIRTYGTTITDRALTITAMPDDGSIVVGLAKSATKTLSTLTRLDAAGNVVWQRVLNEPLIEIRDAAADPSGDIVVAGRKYNPGAEQSPWIAKVDGTSGAFRWQKTTLPGTRLGGCGSFWSIARHPNGGYGLGGYYGGVVGVLGAKIDDAGNLEWQNQYGIYGAAWEAKDIAPTRDGGFVFTAAKPELWTFKVDAAGRVEWCEQLGQSPTGRALGSVGIWIDETTSGDIVVASHQNLTYSPQDDVWVFRFDAGGDLRWERLLHWERDYPAGLVATSDDGCVVAAMTQGVEDTRPWLVKLTAAGAIEWQRTYAEPENGRCRGIDRSSSGDLVVAGISQTHGIRPPGEDLRVMRLGADGRIGVPCVYGTDATGTARVTSSPRANRNGFRSDGFGVGLQTWPTSAQLTFGQPFRTVQCSTNSGPWVNLGSGLAGGAGVAHLAGVGTLQGGAFTSFLANGALPGALAALVTGAAQLNAPLFGGVLVPTPDLVLPVLTDPNGQVQINGFWPSGAPSGVGLFLQLAVVDPGAAFGIAFSNAVRGTTP